MYGPFWTSRERIVSKVLSVHPPVWEDNNDKIEAGTLWGAAAKAECGGAVYGVRRI
jgi:hypothetical protein